LILGVAFGPGYHSNLFFAPVFSATLGDGGGAKKRIFPSIPNATTNTKYRLQVLVTYCQ